jgi:hypothetical protein
MIEASLLKSNFLGRDGFRWWIGQIPPESAHGDQINKGGWGNRFKVRIMGYHPYDITELPDDDLPWAQVLISTTAGSGAGNNATTVKIAPGDVVFGFFLDGDNAQIPVIMGVFGRTKQVLTSKNAGPFQPFTGFTSKIKNDGTALKPDQTNEQDADSQKSPRNVSPAQAKVIGSDEISYFAGIGEVVQLADGSNNTIMGKISTEIDNLLNKIRNASAIFVNIKNEINFVVQKIQAISNQLVGNMITAFYKKLAPLINKGLKLLYRQVYNLILAATKIPAIAHKAGVAAQNAMVIPVQSIQKIVGSLTGSIVGSLGGTIGGLLSAVVDNQKRFVSCASTQFTGALVNDVINKATQGLSAVLGGIGSILKFFPSFSVSGILRTSSDAIKGLVGVLDSNQTKGKAQGMVKQWVIGSGPKSGSCYNFNDVLESANFMDAASKVTEGIGVANNAIAAASGLIGAVNSAAGVANAVASTAKDVVGPFRDLAALSKTRGNKSPSGSCYAGPPVSCGPPIVKIFGGGGLGGAATPLFGSVVGEVGSKTGSIIGVQLTNPGYGYQFPPFVEITDECGQGYGAVARAVLNDDGTIKYIYIVSDGENYPINEEVPYFIDDVVVEESGNDYTENDTVTDENGNEFAFELYNGSITKITPINNPVSDLPVLTVNSSTGSGAVLRPILTTTQRIGTPTKSIDCVS